MVVVSGGGARNPELMRRLGLAFAPVPVVTSDAVGLSADFKEAIAFALLASARLDRVHGQPARGHRRRADRCCSARSPSAEPARP